MDILINFIQRAIMQSTPILFGASGEILTEKSGNLNLGIPGIMYMGGVGGLIAAFMYELKAGENASGFVGMILALLAALLLAAAGGLIYSFLTITLRANQNVVGLALTTFGTGFANFFGGSLNKLAGGAGQVSAAKTYAAFTKPVPVLNGIPVIGQLVFSYGFLVYTAIIIAFALTWFLLKTRRGLNLRAVGENAGTADAAGINVALYKYVATTVGAAIAGLGGLYFVMDYIKGTWGESAFGDRGWLAVALVILSIWNARSAIWGALIFGGLYTIDLPISAFMKYLQGTYGESMGKGLLGFVVLMQSRQMKEVFKLLPYIATIIVLVMTSRRNRPEDQPPASLGLSYFREER